QGQRSDCCQCGRRVALGDFSELILIVLKACSIGQPAEAIATVGTVSHVWPVSHVAQYRSPETFRFKLRKEFLLETALSMGQHVTPLVNDEDGRVLRATQDEQAIE